MEKVKEKKKKREREKGGTEPSLCVDIYRVLFGVLKVALGRPFHTCDHTRGLG